MKNMLLISALALLGLFQVSAQEYEYVPFVREGVKWVCSYPKPYSLSECYFTLEFKGDTVINGRSYKAMHKYSGEEIIPAHDTIPIYMREEGKIVYGIVPDGKTYSECPIGIEEDAVLLTKIISGDEFILYDFNEPVEFIKNFIQPVYANSMVINDMVEISGKSTRRFIFRHTGHDYCLIDGIGYDGISGYPLAVIYNYDKPIQLSKVIDHGETIYESAHYKFREPCDPYLRLTREGVQWVNQLVTVNGNDTTYSYYTFEFKGVDFRGCPILYYYEGDSLDETATQATVFRCNDAYDCNYFTYFVNETDRFRKIMDEGRSMMNYNYSMPSYPLYQFNETQSDISYQYTINYYIYNQIGNWLNRENFVEVEPVIIEDTPCSRFAYYNEQGEPQFYLVEGIGFDSRDMGDLLTPFTRKPDPDAEYQEWCGLSHVIKDGKIIYKGMCYDAAHVEGADSVLDGDVNGDGLVNIADVKALINLLLHENGQSFNAGADLDSNGNVNLKDLVELIDFILVR